jgi:glucose-1-phosphate thymidylyltransferase
MKGIILAGGTGSRLWPSTISLSKQLIPIYDKPLVYYPLSTLMLAGIRDILIITTPVDQGSFQQLLGDGKSLGIKLSYEIQSNPEGLAQALIIGERFIGTESVALILGDNIFHGNGLGRSLKKCSRPKGAVIFGYQVADPQRYGVAEVDSEGKVLSLEEKPAIPKSNLAIPGLYFFDRTVSAKANLVQKSKRGELEITSVNREFLHQGNLKVNVLERGSVWLDTGTFDSLYAANSYVKVIEDRQGVKIACLEEIAWRNGWLSDDKVLEHALEYKGSTFGKYLVSLIQDMR